MRKTTESEPLILRCEDCGAEAQVVGDREAVDVNALTEDWNEEHGRCAVPESVSRIGEFNESQSPAYTLWRDGEAPAWMGEKPSWAINHAHYVGKFQPSHCYWYSPRIQIPVMFAEGEIVDGRSARVLDCISAKIRKHPLSAPHISISSPGDVTFVSVTPSEARELARGLTMLADLAESEPQTLKEVS